MIDLAADVQDYISRGWACLPVCADKIPLAGWKSIKRPPTWNRLSEYFIGPGADAEGVAIVTGEISDGLAVRDFDDQAEYDRWSETHPRLARELPTSRGARAPSVWHRSDLHKTMFIDGGEFRGGRSITLAPRSLHHSGCRYQWLNPLPAGRLPEVPHTEFIHGDVAETAEAISVYSAVSASSVTETGAVLGVSAVSAVSATLDEIIEQTLPKVPGERNARLFDLARGLKINLRMTGPAVKDAVRRWHTQAILVITTKSFDETWCDFSHAWNRVRHPIGLNLVDLAASLFDIDELPACAAAYDSMATKQLIGICQNLANINGKNGTFFISTHDLADRVNLTSMKVWRLMKMLAADGIIKIVETGNEHRATRYIWTGGGK